MKILPKLQQLKILKEFFEGQTLPAKYRKRTEPPHVHDDDFAAIQICQAARGFTRANPDEIVEVVVDVREHSKVCVVSGDEAFYRDNISTFPEMKRAIVEFYKGDWNED